MKTLYLDGSNGIEVGLDGPALRVRRHGRADAHYPLQRVARVAAVGRVRWRPDALNACLHEHKPVAVLDNQGRFVRLLFQPVMCQYGLPRRTGELLATSRFRERYERWFVETEQEEMAAAAKQMGVRVRALQPDSLWQRICLEQHRRRLIRPGGCYRYLAGLASAQIASAFALTGILRDTHSWGPHEHRLFSDTVRLERWRLVSVVEDEIAICERRPLRRELTAAFERTAGERDQRVASWRKQALFAMMGLEAVDGFLDRREKPYHKRRFVEAPATFEEPDPAASGGASNCGRIPFGSNGSFRTSVRILRNYLTYDRRMHELYR